MGQKEDKKDKSKGLVYVTNGGSKQSGLPDPEMSAHSDDVSSDGLPQKKGRRCGRYRCPIITVCAVIAVVAVACAVYFSVTILMDDDDKKQVNSTMTGDASPEKSASRSDLNTRQDISKTRDNPPAQNGAPPSVSLLMPDLAASTPVGGIVAGSSREDSKPRTKEPASSTVTITTAAGNRETFLHNINNINNINRNKPPGDVEISHFMPDLSNASPLEEIGMPRPPGGILRGVPTPEPRSTTSATEASQAEGQAGDQPAAGAPPSPNLRRRTVPRMLPQPPPVNETVETHEAAPGENGHASVDVGHSHSNGTSSGVNAGTGTGAAESNCESGPAGAEGSSSCHGGEAAGPHVSDDGA